MCIHIICGDICNYLGSDHIGGLTMSRGSQGPSTTSPEGMDSPIPTPHPGQLPSSSCLISGRPATPLNADWWEESLSSKVRRSQWAKGLLLDFEGSLFTALPTPGEGALFGRRTLKVEGPSGPVYQGTCQRGGGAWRAVVGVAPGGSSRWKLPPSPAPTFCPLLSCPPECPKLPLHPWAGTEYQFVSLS